MSKLEPHPQGTKIKRLQRTYRLSHAVDVVHEHLLAEVLVDHRGLHAELVWVVNLVKFLTRTGWFMGGFRHGQQVERRVLTLVEENNALHLLDNNVPTEEQQCTGKMINIYCIVEGKTRQESTSA